MRRRRHGPGHHGQAVGGDAVAVETGASPAAGPGRRAGHRGVAGGPRLLGSAESRGRGRVLRQRGRSRRLRLAGGAQLPGARGGVGREPRGQPHNALRVGLPGLPRGARPGGAGAAAAGEGAGAHAPGPFCGWKRGAPPARLRRGLPPWRSYGPSLHWGGQEAAAGGRAGEQRPAQGAGPFPGPTPAGWRRRVSADGSLWGRARDGESQPLPQSAAPGLTAPRPQPCPHLPCRTQALRSHDRSTKPLYVSVGHKTSLQTAVRLTRRCCRFRVPEPVRQADIRSREFLRRTLGCPGGGQQRSQKSQAPKAGPRGGPGEPAAPGRAAEGAGCPEDSGR